MRFVQLSDPHIVPPERQPVLGRDTVAHLRQAVAAVNRLSPAPDFAVLTGDLTNDEAEDSYAVVRSFLDKANVPVYPIPGNHDTRILFRRIILGAPDPRPDRIYRAFVHDGCQIILLDTLDEGQVTGAIDEAQLEWLDDTLTSNPGMPAVVCCHHPPVEVGVPWMDALMLQEADRLLRVLDNHPAVRWVLCGHVHMIARIQRGRVTVLTAPALSAQFRKEPLPPPAEKPHALITDEPPAFRIVDIRNGVFETSICRIAGE